MNAEIAFEGCTLSLYKGDITRLEVDAIVNAANSSLMGGGGVDGAIHRAGGPSILEACKKIPRGAGGRRCRTGEAVATTAGNLKARYVIHTVGPVWRDGAHNEETLLRNAYHNSLLEAVGGNCSSIAFPSISTGVYRYPIEKAAAVATGTVKAFLFRHKAPSKVIFVLFSDHDYAVYEKMFSTLQA